MRKRQKVNLRGRALHKYAKNYKEHYKKELDYSQIKIFNTAYNMGFEDQTRVKNNLIRSKIIKSVYTYKCGHQSHGMIIIDSNVLSYSAYLTWVDSTGISGDRSQCWECYCKESEK